MNIYEASKYLTTGIKRSGWSGYIKASDAGHIAYFDYSLAKTGTTWYPYKQDFDADDWCALELNRVTFKGDIELFVNGKSIGTVQSIDVKRS